ncbi:MAG TPA: hypothetical protein VMB70_13470, partial [Terriglobia bacterium]|nr:hypothetical protein [Terriglobia bacterium]
MKRGEKILVDQFVDQHLRLFSSPPSEEIADAKERAHAQLRLEAMALPEEPVGEVHALRPGGRWRFGLIGAAAVAAVLVVIAIMPGKKIDAHAVVGTEHDGLYRESDNQALHAGSRIGAGEIVRTNRGARAMLKLADGSGIEMR